MNIKDFLAKILPVPIPIISLYEVLGSFDQRQNSVFATGCFMKYTINPQAGNSALQVHCSTEV